MHPTQSVGERPAIASVSRLSKERLIRIKEVLSTIGLGKTTLYALMKEGDFPAPRRVGKLSLWVESEVQAWIAEIANPPTS
jgi:prophage regulatory protein